MGELLSVTRGLKDSYSLSNKQKKNVSSHGSPCIFIQHDMIGNIDNVEK